MTPSPSRRSRVAWPHPFTPGTRWTGGPYCTTCGLPHRAHIEKTVAVLGEDKARAALDYLEGLPDA